MSSHFFEGLSKKTKVAIDEIAGHASKSVDIAVKIADDATGVAANTVRAVARGASILATAAADTAGDAAGSVASKAEEAVEFIKENSPEAKVKRGKIASFRDGIHEGARRMADRAYAYDYALIALTLYTARCDSTVTDEEESRIRQSMKHIRMNDEVPRRVVEVINGLIDNEELTFEDVSKYLDTLSMLTVRNLRKELDELVEIDGRITPEEEAVLSQFDGYVATRLDSEVNTDESEVEADE